MNKISNVLSELGVSKVRLAKYLGVSRQMLYNYLACESLEDWPSEKATRLMQLLEIKSESDLDNLTIDGDYIIKIDTKLNEGVKIALSSSNLVDLKGFNRKEVEVLTDITTLLKDRLKDDKTYGYISPEEFIPLAEYLGWDSALYEPSCSSSRIMSLRSTAGAKTPLLGPTITLALPVLMLFHCSYLCLSVSLL